MKTYCHEVLDRVLDKLGSENERRMLRYIRTGWRWRMRTCTAKRCATRCRRWA